MVVNSQINSTNDSDWQLIINRSRELLVGESQLPRLDFEVSLNTNFIAVEVSTSTAKPSWVAGGYLAQIYEFEQFNLTPPQYFISINQVNLIKLEQIVGSRFNLVYNPPKYFKDVVIKIWQYQGIETNLLLADIANALRNVSIRADVDLSEVNRKLNELIDLYNLSNNQQLLKIESKLNAICETLNSFNCIDKPKKLSKKEKYFLIN